MLNGRGEFDQPPCRSSMIDGTRICPPFGGQILDRLIAVVKVFLQFGPEDFRVYDVPEPAERIELDGQWWQYIGVASDTPLYVRAETL